MGLTNIEIHRGKSKMMARFGLFKKLLFWVLSALFVVLLVELGIFAMVKLELLPFDMPSYKYPPTSITVDDNPYFGTWHKPDSTFFQRKWCLSAEYNFNSYGARDRERTQESPVPRAVMLGDSFVEGYGVNADNRLSNLIETGAATFCQKVSGCPFQFYVV
ncbi:MAG: hypothetical protein ACLQT6_05265 [Desulfomonilaceae bacterium]